MYLTSPAFAGVPTLRHGFFTRHGGISTGMFATLNCGGRDTCEPAAVVDENRRRVAAALEIEADHLMSVQQVHGPAVALVETPWTFATRPVADAMVTRTPGVGLGILTADCGPILFADVRAGVIGAAHSGWKGAFGGVLGATVDGMIALGAVRERITAVIGPTIAQPSYEVDAAFYRRFVDADAVNAQLFKAGSDKHYFFNLPGFIKQQLHLLALSAIHDVAIDTYADERRFYSFRRATHLGESDYGRQISVIALR